MEIPFFFFKTEPISVFFFRREKRKNWLVREAILNEKENLSVTPVLSTRDQFLTSESKMSKSYTAWQDYEWLMEEGADEKLQREVEEELRLAELERLMMQEEQASGDIQMMNQMTNLTMRTSQPPIKSRLNVNAPVFVPSWEQKA